MISYNKLYLILYISFLVSHCSNRDYLLVKPKKTKNWGLFSCFNTQSEILYDEKQNNNDYNESLIDKTDKSSSTQNKDINIQSKQNNEKIASAFSSLNNKIDRLNFVKIDTLTSSCKKLNNEVNKLLDTLKDLDDQNINLLKEVNYYKLNLFLFSILEIPLIGALYKMKYTESKIKLRVEMIKDYNVGILKDFNLLNENIREQISKYYTQIELSNFLKISNDEIVLEEQKYFGQYGLAIKKDMEFISFYLTVPFYQKQLIFFQKEKIKYLYTDEKEILNFLKNEYKKEYKYIYESFELYDKDNLDLKDLSANGSFLIH